MKCSKAVCDIRDRLWKTIQYTEKDSIKNVMAILYDIWWAKNKNMYEDKNVHINVIIRQAGIYITNSSAINSHLHK